MATAADASAAASATAGDVSGNPYETDSVRGKGCRQRPDFDVLRTDIIYSTHFIRCCIRHGHWHAALGGARAFQRRFYDRGFGKEVPEEKSVDYWKGHLNNVVARMKQLDLLHMPDQALGATLLLYLHQVEPRLHDEREELAREVEAAAIRTEAILRSARASFEEVLRSQTETARRMSRQAGAAARTAENASKLAAFRDMGLSRLARATKQVAMRVPALLHQGRAGAARRLLEAARADVAALAAAASPALAPEVASVRRAVYSRLIALAEMTDCYTGVTEFVHEFVAGIAGVDALGNGGGPGGRNSGGNGGGNGDASAPPTNGALAATAAVTAAATAVRGETLAAAGVAEDASAPAIRMPTLPEQAALQGDCSAIIGFAKQLANHGYGPDDLRTLMAATEGAFARLRATGLPVTADDLIRTMQNAWVLSRYNAIVNGVLPLLPPGLDRDLLADGVDDVAEARRTVGYNYSRCIRKQAGREGGDAGQQPAALARVLAAAAAERSVLSALECLLRLAEAADAWAALEEEAEREAAAEGQKEAEAEGKGEELATTAAAAAAAAASTHDRRALEEAARHVDNAVASLRSVHYGRVGGGGGGNSCSDGFASSGGGAAAGSSWEASGLSAEARRSMLLLRLSRGMLRHECTATTAAAAAVAAPVASGPEQAAGCNGGDRSFRCRQRRRRQWRVQVLLVVAKAFHGDYADGGDGSTYATATLKSLADAAKGLVGSEDPLLLPLFVAWAAAAEVGGDEVAVDAAFSRAQDLLDTGGSGSSGGDGGGIRGDGEGDGMGGNGCGAGSGGGGGVVAALSLSGRDAAALVGGSWAAARLRRGELKEANQLFTDLVAANFGAGSGGGSGSGDSGGGSGGSDSGGGGGGNSKDGGRSLCARTADATANGKSPEEDVVLKADAQYDALYYTYGLLVSFTDNAMGQGGGSGSSGGIVAEEKAVLKSWARALLRMELAEEQSALDGAPDAVVGSELLDVAGAEWSELTRARATSAERAGTRAMVIAMALLNRNQPGDVTAAEPWLRSAVARLETEFGRGNLQIAEPIVMLSLSLFHQGRVHDAFLLLEQAPGVD